MKRFLRGIGIFFALIGVGIISAFAVVALLLRQEEVRVPDLTGQDIVAVLEVLNQQGLQIKVDRREPNSILPRDTVVSQTPAAGSGIKKGRQVHVVLSIGASDLQAPNVTGEHFRKADVMIRQAGFFPGAVSRVSSESVDRDIVIAQEPQPESLIDRGGKINLLVSSGKKVDVLIMPKLIGRRAEEAVVIAERMGLPNRITYKAAGAAATSERVVTQQRPSPGSPVRRDATVDIVVTR